MRIDLGEDEQPEIGLIALIDCIFFLLMFFMVTTSFKQQQGEQKLKELPVVLPKSEVSFERSVASEDPLVIGIDRRGRLYIDSKETDTKVLRDRLHSEAASNPQRRIRIDGDGATPYQNIVHVLDLCQFEGLTNISMHTRE